MSAGATGITLKQESSQNVRYSTQMVLPNLVYVNDSGDESKIIWKIHVSFISTFDKSC